MFCVICHDKPFLDDIRSRIVASQKVDLSRVSGTEVGGREEQVGEGEQVDPFIVIGSLLRLLLRSFRLASPLLYSWTTGWRRSDTALAQWRYLESFVKHVQ